MRKPGYGKIGLQKAGIAGVGLGFTLYIFQLFSFFGAKKNLTCKIILPEKAVPTFSCDEKSGCGKIGIQKAGIAGFGLNFYTVYILFIVIFWCQGRIEPVKLFFT